MRLILTATLTGILTAATALSHASEKSADTTLVTVLTAPEPQTQLMAMVLTMQSIRQGASAHILLCRPAADIALEDAPESASAPQEPRGMSPKGLLQTIVKETGTTAEVCAIYLPNAGLDASDLIDGVTPADPAAMASRLIAPDARVLSF